MTIDILRAACAAEPFRQFVISTEAGDSYLVFDPERIALAQDGETAVVFTDGGKLGMIEVVSITDVQTIPIGIDHRQAARSEEDRPMTVENLRAFKRARPFRRFEIRTSSGESYSVRHPELMSFTFDRKGVLVAPGPGRVALIDLANIAELTYELSPRRGQPEA